VDAGTGAGHIRLTSAAISGRIVDEFGDPVIAARVFVERRQDSSWRIPVPTIGASTCTRLKSDPATESIPVILLTGATDIDLTDHAMAVGACDVLTKPCSPDRLLGTIQRVLRRQQKNE
jgi:DNA-binding NarL/FixJ family response regulator